jgi:hypothetical protein
MNKFDDRFLDLIEKFRQCDDDQVTGFEMRVDVSMAIIKFIWNRQLYLFMNGRLIYKRWLDTEQSAVFDVMTYDRHTYTSIRGTTGKQKTK